MFRSQAWSSADAVISQSSAARVYGLKKKNVHGWLSQEILSTWGKQISFS